MFDITLYLMAGAGVGFAVGLTGVGGGSLMTPLLLMFGFSPAVAVGTDLLYAAITKTGGAIAHHRQRHVDWRIVLLLATGSVPASICLHVLLMNSGFQESEAFGNLLTTSLGVMLIVTSIVLIFRKKIIRNTARNQSSTGLNFVHRHRQGCTVVMGIVLGLCVTLSSVGAGAFCAAILLIIYAGIPAVNIVGTDIAHAVPLTLVAGLGYLAAGYVDFYLLASLLAGSLPAIHLGARLSSQVPERLLHRILVTMLLVLGSKYAFF